MACLISLRRALSWCVCLVARDGPRLDDDESRDGSNNGRSEKGAGDADKSEDASERRVTRSQVRRGHGADGKEFKEGQSQTRLWVS